VGERQADHRVIPPAPIAERLAPVPDPLETYARVSHLPHPIFLDSAERGRRGRYSFVAADPVSVIQSRGDAAALGAALDALGGADATPLPGLPPFQGGAAGCIAYEWGSTLECLPPLATDDLGIPDVLLGIYDWVIAWDHQADAAWIVSRGLGGRDPARRLAAVRALLATATPPADRGPSRPGVHRPGTREVPDLAPLPVRSSFDRAGYECAVERVRQYILAGDVFQVNISQRFEIAVTKPPLELYRTLRERHPAGFAALMETEEYAILSASPERFVRSDGVRVETRPIKGTRPRGVTPQGDRALAAELTASAKDRAENVMIVDLMRNDLYRVCRPGTVRVPELCVLESHPTVHHLVSTVEGELAPGADAAALLAAAFPGGSITGAPKVRAMEIIAELEPTRRGAYCGSIGYLSVTGAADFSIAIRTAVVRDGIATVSAGGGITADSDPSAEYDETIAKARGVLAALAAP
jgi:para-aminobenzoate synthetase component 1